MPQADVVLEAQAALGEGPCWSVRDRALWWVDIEGRAVHRYDPATGADAQITLTGKPGAVVERRDGGLAVAWSGGFAGLDPATGDLAAWCQPEPVAANRFNDGKCDAQGRFWAGTMADGGSRDAALYRLDADRRATRVLEGIGCSNGLAWSADGRTMYYIDTPQRRVDALDLDPATGAVSNRRCAIDCAGLEGWPDGMTIDAEGMLWVAFWDGWRVDRFDPRSGARIGGVRVPTGRATSCAFGGDGLADLYITTARIGLGPDDLARQPLAGALFRIRVGTVGLPAATFAG